MSAVDWEMRQSCDDTGAGGGQTWGRIEGVIRDLTVEIVACRKQTFVLR